MTGFTQLFLVTVSLSYTVIMLFVTVASFRHKDNFGAVLIQYLLPLYTALAENSSVYSCDVDELGNFMARKISQKQKTTYSIIPGYTEVANDQPTERAN